MAKPCIYYPPQLVVCDIPLYLLTMLTIPVRKKSLLLFLSICKSLSLKILSLVYIFSNATGSRLTLSFVSSFVSIMAAIVQHNEVFIGPTHAITMSNEPLTCLHPLQYCFCSFVS